LNLWNDFTFQESRLRLRIDRGAKNHQSLFISGRKYSNLGMWGLAIIHLRRAVSRKADVPAYHLALATAYMNIERYDLADESLANAENLVGHEGEVLRLRKQLGSLIKSGNARVRR
jgi:Flp pilus assembly protein TadD